MQYFSPKNDTPNDDHERKARLDILKSYYMEQSAKASEVARSLAFGGAGLCWILKTSDIHFPLPVTIALIFLVAYFISDWLQFYLTSIEYHSAYREERDNDLSEQQRSSIIDNLGTKSEIIFHIKFFLLGVAYIFIAIELMNRLLITEP